MNENTDPFAAPAESDVRIIAPDYTLKKMIGEDVDLKQLFSAEKIEQAQGAINRHKDSFLEWVAKDIATLKEIHTELCKNATGNLEAEIKKLARTAFVIKSQAGTFGFTLATQVAKSLDDFCNQHLKPSVDQLRVIDKHIETLVMIFQKNITGDGGEVGSAIMLSLSKLIDKFKNS